MTDIAKDVFVNLIPESSGGGSGGTSDYTELENKPKINNTTLSGNKTSANLGLQDALVSGTNIKTINSTSILGSGNISITSDVTDVQFNGTTVVSDGVANITSTNIRSVAPACTTITASSTTATISANSTYAHKPATSATYTLVSPSDNSIYSGFVFIIDTTDSASFAFQTDGSPSATVKLNGNVNPETGKKYTVTGQWDVINSVWQLFILDYSVS